MSEIGNTTPIKPETNRILPSDWRQVQLREVVDISHGFPFSSEYFSTDGEFTLLTPGNFYEEGGFRSAGEKQKFFAGPIPDGYVLPPKTLIVAMTEQADGLLGSSALVPQDNQYLHNQRIGRVSVKSNSTVPGYLFYLFNGKSFRSKVRETAAGTKVKHTSPEKLTSIEVFLPPCEEQVSICSALSDIDTLISCLDLLIAKKRDIQQAAMQQLLSGQRRLPGFGGEWVVRRLGDIAHIKTGSKNNQDKVENGEYPFYVRSATVENINSYSHDCEAILIPREGGIGRIFHYINGRFDVHQRVYVITHFTDGVLGKYVHLYMSARFGAHAMQNSVKATVDSLRLPTFQVFEVLLPPTKEEQAAIAEVLTDMNTELASIEARRDKARQIKEGMMQELLTGKIRLS